MSLSIKELADNLEKLSESVKAAGYDPASVYVLMPKPSKCSEWVEVDGTTFWHNDEIGVAEARLCI